ncbi:hypothetical protein ACFQV2_38590 [Actinokineospora soli]|uniref:Uncharacterized protein n=1 Tax=Actinokineospora soli TaxID=1048753 RepID=A0ABW2U0D2_9PSEU
MDVEQSQPGFDPLVEFEGVWTTELAEQYLPIPGAPPPSTSVWTATSS